MRYQAYAWDGSEYVAIGFPARTKEDAMKMCMNILNFNNEYTDKSVLKYWRQKEIVVKEVT